MIDDYLEFKLIGNFWKIINKRGCFSFEQMVKGNNFNKWCFIPVSRCSGDWKKNINNDYTLNYNEVTPLKKVYTDDDGLEVRESVNYPPIELYMQSYDNGGLTVQVSSATPIVEIGNVAQDMAGVFIVNKVTNIVLAFCILPESFKVYNFISFLYDGYLLEINNPVMVDKPKLPDITKLDTNLTITLDKDSYYIDDIISFNGVLKSSDGELVKGAEVLFNEKRYITNDKGEFSDTVKASLNLTLDFIYGGSPAYNECSRSVSVQVSKIPVSFVGSASSTNVYVGETVTISGTLETSTGSPLGNVKIIDGAGQVKAITGATGVWSFTSVEDTVGTSGWSLYPDLDWDKYNTPKNVDIQITIRKKDTVLTCTVDKSSVTVEENVLCTLYLKDKNNQPLANKTVYCKDWSKTTNDEGRVIFNYVNPSTGAVTKVFKFDGDNLYNGASVTAKWTVVPAESPQISISASTLIGEVGDDLPITLSSNLKNTALTVLLNDSEVADSVTTDNTGNAVFNYNCNGAGDVNVKVKYLSGTNVYYSNILQVEDCIKYGFKDSDTWVNPTGHSATNTVVDGVFTSTSNSSKGDSILQLDLTGDFIITYDAQWQASTRCGVGAKDTTRTQHFDSGTDSNGANQKYVSYNGSNETDTIYKNSNIAEYVNCKIIKQNNTLTGYMNNTEVVSVDYGWISTCTVWNFHTTIWDSDKTLKIKNLKIKLQ